ncbi:MAG TPA: hypothetical protein PL115_00920 [Bacteroidales bacterium]|jgi:MraZ protein|nr:hypothetical protein [Bacteroidales bacterium]HPB89239.1 hypothetical protein [Bacteroidales bacterium]HPY21669.1 hypothetical protein [Bacteroidales bacterium]HQA92881.1 hypothetical protein [Bacteroidales bacterium]HQN23515.1 hypothetical protein [Bacteroidales bacterium]
MAKFIGEYKAKVDDKGRLIFPSAFKSAMGIGADLRFVIKKSLFSECLEMYTYAEWEKESELVRSRLNFFNRDHAEFWREYMRGSHIVEPDEKLGRMSVPKDKLDSIGVLKDVVFFGNNHKIEIWAKEKFEAQQLDSDAYVALAEKILG